MARKTQLYGAASALVFIGMVVACLWPFHSPLNQVSWLEQGNGLRFGDHGTIVSRGTLTPFPQQSEGWTVELWLRPVDPWLSDTILAFYDARRPRGFSVRQVYTDLAAEDPLWRSKLDPEEQAFEARGVFRRRPLVFLTLTSGVDGTTLYADGKMIKREPQVRIPSDDFGGRLVVANSPVDNDSWSGDLKGLALYGRELNQAEVSRHYTTWTETGSPAVAPGEEAAALYLFREGSGTIVHNEIASGADLYIPERYLEVHQAFLKRPWNEYSSTWSYWKSALINVAGFVPLGFLLYGYLFLKGSVRRGALLTILVGALLSLTVEILQASLPTRDSGMTDIITNTLGTGIGVALRRWTSLVCQGFTQSRHANLRRLALLLSYDENIEEAESARVCSDAL